MTGAGDLRERVAFEAPLSVSNGQGGAINGWAPHVTVWAKITYLRGGETVLAARLTGRQSAVVTVRASRETRLITPEYRMRDTRTGTIYNIRTIVPAADRAFLELTVESGVAT